MKFKYIGDPRFSLYDRAANNPEVTAYYGIKFRLGDVTEVSEDKPEVIKKLLGNTHLQVVIEGEEIEETPASIAETVKPEVETVPEPPKQSKSTAKKRLRQDRRG